MTQYIRIVNPWFLELDTNGRPAADYKVYTLQAGSVATLVDTYSNRELTTLNTNPVILNALGEAHIFSSTALKLVYTSPTGDLTSPIWTDDYVGEQQNTTVDKGEATGTANNIYNVDIVPTYASIPDGFSLVMIPDIANLDTLITRTFTGTGINDCFFEGPYVGSTSSTFSVEIDAAGAPDTFRWRKDAGAWTAGVPITGDNQTLADGLTIVFSATTGHTLADLWTQSVRPPAYLDFCNLGNKIIYKSEDGALTALSGNDIIAGIPAHLDYSQTEDCWILLNPSLPVLSTQVPYRYRKEVTAVYSVDADDDWGREISCKGTFTVTLPSCSDAAQRFYYINNAGTGVITVAIDGAPDVILIPGAPAGVTSLALQASTWLSIQLGSNGVDWHLMTATNGLHGIAVLSGVAWVCPPGVTTVWATGCAGGGGGAGNGLGAVEPGGGGSAGGFCFRTPLTVVPGTSYANAIGAAGLGGDPAGGVSVDGNAGTNTTFGALLTLTGGAKGVANAGFGGTIVAFGVDGQGGMFGSGGKGGFVEVGVTAADAPGADGVGRGSGGGGGVSDAPLTEADGGDGMPGFLTLEW